MKLHSWKRDDGMPIKGKLARREEKVRIINLTPHELTLVGGNDTVIGRIAPTGQVARVITQATRVGQVMVGGYEVPIVSTAYGKVENLPKRQIDTTYVVSIMVVQALGGKRSDVVAPDTGPQSVVRDAQGQIKGVRRFTR